MPIASKPPSLKALILGLFSIIDIATGNKNPEAKTILNSVEVADWSAMLPELPPTIKSVLGGKGTDFTDLSVGLKRFILEYKKEQKQNMVVLASLVAFKTYFASGDVRAWAALESVAHNSAIPTWVGKMFVKSLTPQRSIRKRLEALVKLMTGLRQPSLPAENAPALKAKFPTEYADYLMLRREFNKNWKDALSQFVLKSNKKVVDFKDVEQYFHDNEIESTWPTGFVGKIDGVGNIFTTKGEKIAGGLPTKAFFPAVRMNTSGEGDWVFQAYGVDGQLTSSYAYTEAYGKATVEKKFEVVDILTGKIDQIQAKWRVGLKKFDESDPTTVACLMLELLYSFSARIGSIGNAADGEDTFGLGTLLRSHVKVTATSFVMAYRGKDGVATKHVLKATDVWSKIIVAAVNVLCADKKPNEFLFTYTASNGSRKRLPSAFVNKLFKTYGAGDATVHKMRTLRATKIFNDAAIALFAKKGRPVTPKQVMDTFKEIATECGKALNHVRRGTDGSSTVTPMTAIQSYIDVAAQVKFFQSYNCPLPGFLQKRSKKLELSSAVGEDLEEDEFDSTLIDEFLNGEDLTCLS